MRCELEIFDCRLHCSKKTAAGNHSWPSPKLNTGQMLEIKVKCFKTQQVLSVSLPQPLILAVNLSQQVACALGNCADMRWKYARPSLLNVLVSAVVLS